MKRYAVQQLPRVLVFLAVVAFLIAGLQHPIGLLALGLAAWALADLLE